LHKSKRGERRVQPSFGVCKSDASTFPNKLTSIMKKEKVGKEKVTV